jgi:putative transposase
MGAGQYLCIIMDLYLRNIVGWSMEERLTTDLALKSLKMACAKRDPEEGFIFHSDRGPQYASNSFRTSLFREGFFASMSWKVIVMIMPMLIPFST